MWALNQECLDLVDPYSHASIRTLTMWFSIKILNNFGMFGKKNLLRTKGMEIGEEETKKVFKYFNRVESVNQFNLYFLKIFVLKIMVTFAFDRYKKRNLNN